MTIKVIRASDIEMSHRGGPPGAAYVGRAISSDLSPSMAAGIAEFDQCSIDWQVLYDEVIYVIEGTFSVKTHTSVHNAHSGDIMWIPKGTKLSYEGETAKVFYVVYPGDWKDKFSI